MKEVEGTVRIANWGSQQANAWSVEEIEREKEMEKLWVQVA